MSVPTVGCMAVTVLCSVGGGQVLKRRKVVQLIAGRRQCLADGCSMDCALDYSYLAWPHPTDPTISWLPKQYLNITGS